MERQQNFMPKKRRTFFDWLILRHILRKNPKFHFTVPTHICELSCGCKRAKNDSPFFIKIINGDLFHHKGWGYQCPLLDKDSLLKFLTKEESALLEEESAFLVEESVLGKELLSSKKVKKVHEHHYFC